MKSESGASFAALTPDIARGARAAFVTLVPYYFAAALHRPELAWMALGGWLGTMVDPGGPRRARARLLVAFVPVGALLVLVCESASRSMWTGTAAVSTVAFVMSLLRAAGGGPGSLGTFSTMVAAVAAARPPVGGRAVDAIAFAAGAVLALIVSSILWPVWTHLPVRRAVSEVYAQLGDYVGAIDEAVRSRIAANDPRWTSLIRDHHRRIRAAIEEARTIVVDLRARRRGETDFGSAVRSLLGVAEAQFPLLAALAVDLESLAPADRPDHAVRLRRIAKGCREVWRTLVTRDVRRAVEDTSPAAGRVETGAAPTGDPPNEVELPAPPNDSASFATGIVGRLEQANALATDLARWLVRGGEEEATVDLPSTAGDSLRPPPDPGARSLRSRIAERRGVRAVRDALSPKSLVFQHAVRVACAVAVASIAGRMLSVDRSYWATLTTVSVLQPDPGATAKRAGERVLGTVLGSIVAVVVIVGVRSPVVLALLLVPLSMAAVVTRPRSYRLFTFFLTPVFVLLADRSHDWRIAGLRAGDAVIGGLIALLAGVLVAPASQRRRLPELLEAMFSAVAAYANAVLAGEPGSKKVDGARRAAGVAIGAAETALERFLAEPLGDRHDAADAVLLVTYARRLATALTYAYTLASTLPATNESSAAIAAYVATVLRAAAARGGAVAEPAIPAPPDTKTTGPAIARIIRWTALIGSHLDGERTASSRRAASHLRSRASEGREPST